jgi:hypothetical protein
LTRGEGSKQFDTEFHKVHTEFQREIRIALRAKHKELSL